MALSMSQNFPALSKWTTALHPDMSDCADGAEHESEFSSSIEMVVTTSGHSEVDSIGLKSRPKLNYCEIDQIWLIAKLN